MISGIKRSFIKSFLLFMVVVVSSLSYFNPIYADTINGETIDTNGSLTVGTTINYWIDSSNEYTVSIPAAITRLMYHQG